MSANNSQPTDQTPADNSEAEDAEMLKFAAEADKAIALGEPTPEFKGKPATTTEPAKGKDGQPADKGKVDDQAKKPDDKSGAKPEDKKGDDKKPEDKKPDDKKGEESEFEKAKKEQARQKEVLAGFQKEKDEFRQQKQKIENELATLRREVTELRKGPKAPPKDKHGLDANDYDKLAKDYENEGKSDMAQAAKDRAAELRKQADVQPEATTTAGAADFKSPEFQAEWKKNCQALIDKDPELGKPGNPVVIAANSLVNHEVYGRFFRSAPDGIHAAVEVAQIMQTGAKAAAELKTTTEELAKAKVEIDRLTKLTQPQGSNPAAPAQGDKKPEDMSDDEVMAAARAADRAQNTG